MVTFLLYSWGLAPKPPEFNALSKKMKCRSERLSFTPASPSFFHPTPALGFALQHHPILLVGLIIICTQQISKQAIKFLSIIQYCKSMFKYYNSSLIFLNNSPVFWGISLYSILEDTISSLENCPAKRTILKSLL